MSGFMVFATISGFLGVALGAFGAHGLAPHLTSRALEIYQTAVQYQMIHTLALLGFLLFRDQKRISTLLPAWGFSVGIVVFSGSLYLLAVTGVRWLGAVTPVGGVAFLLGWLSFAWASSGKSLAKGRKSQR